MTIYEKWSLILESLVVLILIAEFVYDALWNSRDARLKRHRQKKQKPQFESLTTGDSK